MSATPSSVLSQASASLLLLALSACGSSSEAPDAGCSLTVPATCQSPVPSYGADIQPIIHASCGPCHLPGGVSAAKHDFSTYLGVASQRGTIQGQVSGCLMPFPGAPPLPHTDGEKLLDWLVCGAPNN